VARDHGAPGHTHASLLLVDGVSPAYVQEQLGHASIELTVGTYGRWLRKQAPGAVDRLDGKEVVARRPKMVAATDSGPRSPSSQVTEMAEREGFEPSVAGSPLHVISSHADSTTLASLRLWEGAVPALSPEPRRALLKGSLLGFHPSGPSFGLAGGEGGIRTHGTR
jgi:hypothetical protein